jgi:RNA polymerase sigma factor (sigma-70 family)
MAETPESGRKGYKPSQSDAGVPASEVEAWFVCEVLPLEAALMHFLQSSYRKKNEISDLRQDVYAQVIEAAQKQIPDRVKPFLFTIARHLLINRIRRDRVVSIESVADLDDLGIAVDAPGPDRTVIARDELRRLRAAIDKLPPRCRETIVLGRIEGLTGREIAERMGITESTVSHYVANGMRALADLLYGAPVDIGDCI